MADERDDDPDDRTEAPSERALGRARDEGNLPLSRDVVPVAALLAVAAALPLLGSTLLDGWVSLISRTLQGLGSTSPQWDAAAWGAVVWPALGLMGAVAAAGLAAGLAQTQGGFWPQRVAPDLSRVFNTAAVTHMFTKDFLVDLGVSLIKLVVLCGVAWNAAAGAWPRLAALGAAGHGAAVGVALASSYQVLLPVVSTMVVLAALDVALTRYRFTKKHKMTRQDLKREHREDEGDPLLKGKRKSRARELVKNRVASAVPKADVVVVNPTHIAVAIAYTRGKDRAPRVVAKGKGAMAQAIRDLANAHGVPVMEDVPLARLLYRKVKVGREVPAETYRAVAAVLAFVFRVTGRSGGGL